MGGGEPETPGGQRRVDAEPAKWKNHGPPGTPRTQRAFDLLQGSAQSGYPRDRSFESRLKAAVDMRAGFFRNFRKTKARRRKFVAKHPETGKPGFRAYDYKAGT